MAKDFITNLVIGGKLNPSLQQSLSKVGKVVSKTASGLGKVGAIAGKALAGIGTAAIGAAGIAGAATVKMMGGFLESADSLEKMRAQTGLTYSQLQKLQYIGGQLSVSMDSITNAATYMNKNMLAATKAGSDSEAVFKALKISVTNVNGAMRPQSAIFNESLAALSSIANESERNAMAYKVFGKGAKEILPLLDAGTGEIKRMSDEADKLGLVLSDDAIKAGDDFGDTLERLKGVVSAVGGKLMAGLVPTLQKLADTVLASLPQIMPVVSEVFGTLGQAFTDILPSILPLVRQLLPALASIFKSLLPVIPPIASFISGLIPLITPIIQMLTPFIAQFIQTMLPALMEVAQALLPVIFQLLQALLPVLQPLMSILAVVVGLIGKGLAEAIKFVMPVLQWWFDILSKIYGAIANVVGGVAKFLGIGSGDKPKPTPVPGYASGGIATRPSIFGEAGPEMAIPLERTPRSLGLLNKTAQILGAETGGAQIIYAPQIYGANRAEIEPVLRSGFEQFKAWFEQLKIENGRVAY